MKRNKEGKYVTNQGRPLYAGGKQCGICYRHFRRASDASRCANSH